MESQKQRPDNRSDSTGESPRAVHSRHSALSQPEEDAIQQALASGRSPKEVALEVGVSVTTVYRRRKQLGCGPSSRLTWSRETELPTATHPIHRRQLSWKRVALGILAAILTVAITWVLIEFSYSNY